MIDPYHATMLHRFETMDERDRRHTEEQVGRSLAAAGSRLRTAHPRYARFTATVRAAWTPPRARSPIA